MATDKPKKPGWEERAGKFEISFINEPVADVVEPESAVERARRRWGMADEKGEKEPNQ
jgi:hypothetical protein